jgi:hypothetical protein
MITPGKPDFKPSVRDHLIWNAGPPDLELLGPVAPQQAASVWGL